MKQPPQPLTRPGVHQWIYLLEILFLIGLVLLLIRPFLWKEELKIRKPKKNNTPRVPQTTTLVPTTTTVPPLVVPDYANPDFMDACYSTRLVVSSYRGPVIKVEKNDGTQQDFYTDATQSFLSTIQGLSLTDWLGSGVGKVRVWYDQSGNGNDALCYSSCPMISTLDSSRYVIKFQQYIDSGFQMEKPVKPNAIFFQFWHDNNNPAKIISTNVDPAIDQYYGVIIQNGNIYGNKSQYDWYYVGKGDKDFTINQDDSPEYDLSEWNTVCLSISDPDYSSNDKEDLSLIGKDLTGYLSELILYNQPMSQDDMDIYNKNMFDVKEN